MRFTKCGICLACTELIRTSDCPGTVSIAKKKRDKHWERVTTERLHVEAAILESRRRPDMLFCETDGMDSSKTLLPHSATWSKDVVKDKLLKVHLTCVKSNGMRPDDVYAFTDVFLHDSSCTITVMWLTILKDLERRGSGEGSEPLRKVHFQLDNICRENKNRYVMCFAEWLVAKGVIEEVVLSFLPVGTFSRRLGGYSAKTLPKLFQELRRAFTQVCHFEILEGVIDWKEFLGGALLTKGQVLNISHAYQFSFDFCADDIEEWVHTLRGLREKQWDESRPFDKFWHEDAEELQSWLRNRPPCRSRGPTADTGTAAQPKAGPAAHNARNAAELPHNAEAAVRRMIEVMQGLRWLEWNPVTTIGPWKTNDDSIKQFFDACQANLVIMDMSEHHENITEAERLALLGDWEATRSVGKIRKHKDLKDPDESKRQLKLVSYEPWVPDRSGNPEIPRWLETFGGSEKMLEQWEPWNDLLIVIQFQGQEQVDGVYLAQDSLDHVRLRLEYIELKTFLTAFQYNDSRKIEAARKMRLVQPYLSKGRKRDRELAEMDIDPAAQLAQLHCADMFDLDYNHH
eukprot:jgi/Tetstr1/426787/TSEL_017002.t1